MPALRVLLVFAVTFSLVSLPSALSNSFNLPSIHLANATNETGVGNWYPAGAQEQTLTISEGNGVSSTCLGWLSTNQVDACDWPLTATEQSSCAGSTGIFCSLPVPDHGYFEIEFNLAGVIWGIPMDYGNSAAGVELRQGFAHLFNKQSFITNNAACAGVVCVPNDAPIPVCTTSAGCTNGGLPAANPCSWDTKYSESSPTNCVVGAPGGTSYNCSFAVGVCPTGTVTGTTTFAWQAQIGSPDFCAAAQHFIQAFADANITGVTTNPNCELLPPKGGWPSVVTAINTANNCVTGTASTANVCVFVRSIEPRKSLGEGLTQDVCALFSPAFVAGGWTTLAAQPFSCDNTNTGTANAACGGSSCPFLREVEGTLGAFCGLTTSITGIPNNCWGFGTFGFGQVFPFDSTTYFEYNSIFATETTVTCTNANCSTNVPGSPCEGPAYSNYAADFNYVCSPRYDNLTKVMEFSSCLASPSTTNLDPTFNQASPTFASCAGTAISGGTGAATCIGASPGCTAVSAGYQAIDYFGSHAFTIPVWTGFDVQARLSNWPLGGSTPGFITALSGGYSASASIWEWLDAYSSTPAVPGTFRQGFLTTVESLNPFVAYTLWDFYVLSNIYDSLFVQNPQCITSFILAAIPSCSSISQYIDWMTTSHSFLCYPGGPPCTASTLGYGNSTFFAGTTADLRLTLNRNNHWQDGGPVTAWDVKYSFINLNATGTFQATSLTSVAHINVIDEFTLDLNLKAKGPFTEFFFGGITIIPGHLWSACGANTWNSGVTNTNVVGASIVKASEDKNCVGFYSAPCLFSNPYLPQVGCIGWLLGGTNSISYASPFFDPVTNGFLIGSGPYSCENTGANTGKPLGALGTGCSIDNTQSPAPGSKDDFRLTRTGCTLTSTGTTCGVAGSSTDYFHSSGALASYVWTGDIGSGSADFARILTVNSCHSSTPSANCPHWAQGIGNPGGTGANPVGLAQRLKVNSYRGVSWINFGTEKSNGSLGILACAAGYTLPGTTIAPCNSTNAGWTPAVLPGIGNYASILYEVGSQITIGTTTTSTSTLPPASVVGCTTNYPNGGYDC